MKINEFIENLKEILELEDVELIEDTYLIDLKEFDSLSIMSIIAFIDENFNKKLTSSQINSITTVSSLIKLIGLDSFEE